ncbi:MAG: hypothetical protein PHG25_01355 [Candidatus Pacebacteria bacterium]|nr:hypothetical protein [Candidatus Paceibacterota bacterium]
MALTDINFQEGDGQDFTLEVPTGISNPALDILVESSGAQYLLMETPLITGGGGGNIFIMSE